MMYDWMYIMCTHDNLVYYLLCIYVAISNWEGGLLLIPLNDKLLRYTRTHACTHIHTYTHTHTTHTHMHTMHIGQFFMINMDTHSIVCVAHFWFS